MKIEILTEIQSPEGVKLTVRFKSLLWVLLHLVSWPSVSVNHVVSQELLVPLVQILVRVWVMRVLIAILHLQKNNHQKLILV